MDLLNALNILKSRMNIGLWIKLEVPNISNFCWYKMFLVVECLDPDDGILQ